MKKRPGWPIFNNIWSAILLRTPPLVFVIFALVLYLSLSTLEPTFYFVNSFFWITHDLWAAKITFTILIKEQSYRQIIQYFSRIGLTNNTVPNYVGGAA